MKHAQFVKMMKEARVKSGLTQAEISKKLGYSSPQFLSNFERNICVFPLEKLKVLGPLIGVSTGKIFDCLMRVEQERLKRGLGL